MESNPYHIEINEKINTISDYLTKIENLVIYKYDKISKIQRVKIKAIQLLEINIKIPSKKLQKMYSLYPLLKYSNKQHYLSLDKYLNKQNLNIYLNDIFIQFKQNKTNSLLLQSIIFYYDIYNYKKDLNISTQAIDIFWLTVILYNYNNIFAYIPIEVSIYKYQNRLHKALSSNKEIFIILILDIILVSCKYFLKKNTFNNFKSSEYRKNYVIKEILLNNNITQYELTQKLNYSLRTIKRDTDELKSLGLLTRKGSKKTGKWEVDKSLVMLNFNIS